jgi:diguanylate cyclase (GGDEF)-like protein
MPSLLNPDSLVGSRTGRDGQVPGDDTRRIFVLLHGLLIAVATYGVLAGLSDTLRASSLVVLGIAAIVQVLVYVLPAGYISNRQHQRMLILLGVVITAAWVFPLAMTAQPWAWAAIVAVLIAPLVIQRVAVWVVCTALAVAIVVVGREAGWLASGSAVREAEFLLVQLFLVIWVIFAFLFDSLTLLGRMRKELGNERTQAQVLSEIASSLLAANDTRDVFRAVEKSLQKVLDARQCALLRVDPLRNKALLVIASEDCDPADGEIDLPPTNPMRRALSSEEPLSVTQKKVGQTETLTIPVNSGLAMPLLITCQVSRNRLEPEHLALARQVAQAAVKSIQNMQLLRETRAKARTDPLTGLPNRRSFESDLHREFERARRHERPLSLLMIDLDFLKKINDEHGHPVGDSVIQTAADIIISASRDSDYLASRFGGEEFAVILPETDLEGAAVAAQRICETIAASALPTVGQFTASIGAACYPINALTPKDLLETADEALYVAKREGRNRVVASVAHTLV